MSRIVNIANSIPDSKVSAVEKMFFWNYFAGGWKKANEGGRKEIEGKEYAHSISCDKHLIIVV
jgi:hypothetical protein